MQDRAVGVLAVRSGGLPRVTLDKCVALRMVGGSASPAAKAVLAPGCATMVMPDPAGVTGCGCGGMINPAQDIRCCLL